MIDVVLVCDQGYFGGSVVSGSTFKCVRVCVCARYKQHLGVRAPLATGSEFDSQSSFVSII